MLESEIPAEYGFSLESKQCGIGTKVELEVKENHIILKPVKHPRQGWAAAFQHGDDQPLTPDGLDADLLEEWNRK